MGILLNQFNEANLLREEIVGLVGGGIEKIHDS